MLVDFALLYTDVPLEPTSEVVNWADTKSFVAPSNGKCVVSANGFIKDAAQPFVEMYITYKQNTTTYTLIEARAELNGDPIMQSATTDGFPVAAGYTYTLGVTFKVYEDAVSPDAVSKATLTWVCQFE